MRRLLMLTMALSLTTGCFAEIAGGYYLVDESGTTLPSVESKGYMVGLNFGVFYDHKQQVRGSVQITEHVLPVDVGDTGTGIVRTDGVAIQGDYQFMHFSQDKTIGVTAGAGYGRTTVTLEPEGAAKVEGSGNGMIDLFGGLIMHLPYAHGSHMAGALMVGGEIWRAPSDQGDFSAIGVTGRFRLSWSPIVWRRQPAAQ